LAACAVAACGAGSLVAFGQQPASTSTSAAPAATTAGTQQPATATSKQRKQRAPQRLAAATAGSQAAAPVPQAATVPTTTSNPAPAQLQTIIITGSLIARTSIETPNPVQIISSKDMVQSGYTDVSDVLRNISANGAGTLSPSFSFAFAFGGSGISLRGLALGDTLVLIDGERSVPYPLLDDNERNFVDLSSIPFTAIQQVQVLKDGGSALYGSDAIAGVVNVMLRKEYQGFQVTTESGTTQHGDGTTEHLGFIGGEGDLAADGYNWYVSGDLRHQDQILAVNRTGQWDSLNFTAYGGNNKTPGAAAAENPGIPYPSSLTGYLINPTTSTGLPYAYLPGCDATSQALDRCTFVYPKAQLQPSDTSIDVLGKFTKELAGGWEFGLQASWFYNKTDQTPSYNGDLAAATATGYGIGGLTNTGLAPGGAPKVVTFPPITVPANYPGNPFGVPAPLIYTFPEIGAGGENVVDTNTYRLLTSLHGNVGGWSIDGSVGAMFAKMDITEYGLVEPAALQTALNNGYILGSSTGSSLFAPPEQTTPTSQLDLIDVHGTHELFELPGGPLNLAIGVQWNKTGHDETPPPAIESGASEGDSIYVIGNEYDSAAFAELDGQVFKQLEIDADARYDSYKTFGSDTTPKIGVKFTPWRWVALRSTWSKGFRVPSVAEGVSSGETFGAGNFDDTVLCPAAAPKPGLAGPGDFPSQCSFPLVGVQTANPKLQDVKSTNFTAGIVLQPAQQASLTVDYYNIKIDGDIIPAYLAGARFGGSISTVRGPQALLPYCPPSFAGGCTSSQLVNTLTPVGVIEEEQFPYVNASSTQVSGYDVDLTYHWDAGKIGRFTGEATWTHELTYKLIVAGSSFELAGTHGPSDVSGDTGNPKDRINARLTWSKGPVQITPSINFIGHFSIIDPSSGVDTCGSAGPDESDGLSYNGYFAPDSLSPANEQFCTVKSFFETNLYGSYQAGANLELHVSVTNLFNKQPPVDVQTYGGGSMFFPYDPALEQDGAVGRFYLVGLTYTF
jgi:iron complex outermembrane receptor protein